MLLCIRGSVGLRSLLCYCALAVTECHSYEYYYSGLSDFVQDFCRGAYNYTLIVGSDASGIERESPFVTCWKLWNFLGVPHMKFVKWAPRNVAFSVPEMYPMLLVRQGKSNLPVALVIFFFRTSRTLSPISRSVDLLAIPNCVLRIYLWDQPLRKLTRPIDDFSSAYKVIVFNLSFETLREIISLQYVSGKLLRDWAPMEWS